MKRLTNLVLILLYLSLTLTGCEAFRKKFVRKPKRKREVRAVVHTQEYESDYSLEKTYKKYFLFWRISHDELINLLDAQDASPKKRVFTAKRIIENLQQMRQLLLIELQTRLDVFILEQEDFIKELDKYNLSRIQRLRIKSILKKQRRQIQKEFNYKNIQEYLIKE